MSEDKLRDAVNKGYQAQRLMEDEAFSEAFDTLKNAMIAKWHDDTTLLPEDRERLWVGIRNLERLRSTLMTTVTNGRVAQKDIDLLIGRNRAA